MKALFVSLNSLQEHSGGGLYVRSLYRGASTCAVTEAIVKGEGRMPRFDAQQRIWTLPKNGLIDLLARLFGSPSFVGAWFPLVLWRALGADIVLFHNSRHGLLLLMCKLLYPWKRFVVISDNVEQKLNSDIRTTSLLRRSVQGIDALLIPLAEYLSYRYADVHAFITADDCRHFESRYGPKAHPSPIIPVYLPQIPPPEPAARGHGLEILFTASFRHSPNVSALKTVFELARRRPTHRFVVAGLALGQVPFVHEAPANVSLHDSPCDAVMQALFRQADLYFCPVDEGSGMKTKIAEALQSFIPALVSTHSAIGYEVATAAGAVMVYASLDEALQRLDAWSALDASRYFALRMRAGAVYNQAYSEETGRAVFAALFQALDGRRQER